MTTLLRAGPVEATKMAFGRTSGINPPRIKPKIKLYENECPLPLISNLSRSKSSSFLAAPSATSTLFGKVTVRYSHTDIKFPDMTHYRKDSSKDPTVRAIENDDVRKIAPYFAYGAAGMIGLYMTKYSVRMLVEYKSSPRDMLSMASIEINLKDIPEGKSSTFMWRGKPVFVRHKTQEQIATDDAVDVSTLRHPETPAQRTTKPEWMVAIGICTHLGCVPVPNLGKFNGYYCPCHGSHYDTTGRIRAGPAPLNLEVPDHKFTDNDMLIVGVKE